MAKEKKSRLEQARQELSDAQRTYGKIVRRPTGQTSQQQAEHLKSCRKALADKRYAAGVVEALIAGREPPKREDVVESQR